MKFLADMGISPRTVMYLRELGYDTVHLYELGLERLPDSEILDKARLEDRIVLTSDLDFGDLLAASRAVLPSVIIFRLRDMRPNNVNQYLTRVLDRNVDGLQSGVIISVSERRLRARPLPI